MVIDFTVPDRVIKEPTTLFQNICENNSFPAIYKGLRDINFPIACIGRDSYVWGAKLHTGIEFTISKGYAIHNLQIGNFVSIAPYGEYNIAMNHNYLNLAMGVSNLFEKDDEIKSEFKMKGQILIQNDVWIGQSVSVMHGVTIHNGAVVAANSHVVKDVPPYAIVGGNPAKIIKYRFSKDIIDKLLTIQWWNWNSEKIQKNSEYFYNEDINKFCDRFYDEALEEKKKVKELNIDKLKYTYLFFPDFIEQFYVWERVIQQFADTFKENDDCLLILYIEEEFANTNSELVNTFNLYIDKVLLNNCAKCSITICIDTKENERAIFKSTDYFITTRSKDTILHSCYADENNVEILSGVDEIIF
ncbi:CatB-related O-acetyltransferase [Clostridium cibarium]|nr:CatB-related O-acetyltransferase [Clostridium cibarium]